MVAKFQSGNLVEAKTRKVTPNSAPPKPSPPSPAPPKPKPNFVTEEAKPLTTPTPPSPPPTPTPTPVPAPVPTPTTKKSSKPELDLRAPFKLGQKSTAIKSGKLDTAKDKFSYSTNRWQAPKILKTNLISGEVTTFVSWSKNLITAGTAIGLSLLLVVVLFFALSYWETIANQEGEALEEEIKVLDRQISELKSATKDVDQFQKRLDLAAELLNNHIYWTNFFTSLEGMIIEEARILNDIRSSMDGNYIFNLKVSSFDSVYNQIRVLRNHPDVVSVEVNSGSFSEAVETKVETFDSFVTFEMIININPEILFDREINEEEQRR